MYLFTIAIATVAAVGPVANAHGVGIPKIMGLDFADLKARNLIRDINARIAQTHGHDVNIEARQDSPPECGEGVGSCPAGKCCSRAGFCGTGERYCYAPGCKYQYGPGCPENNPPAGSNTSSVNRDKVGSLPYGGDGIFNCVTPGTVALTYDDGPQIKTTDRILDLFKSYDAKGTFFVTGNNVYKGQIDIKHADTLKRIDDEGHQIGSHTFTHLNLSQISSLDRKNQMWMNEMAIRNVVGKIPTYMRPPYSACNKESGCQQDMADLGYHITNFDVDTDDYNQNNDTKIQTSKDRFKTLITNNSSSSKRGDRFLAISHDTLEQTANNLTEFMLSTLTQLGYKAVTVGDCLGDPKANWYRTASGAGNSSNQVTNTSLSGDDSDSGNQATGSGTGSSPPASTGAAGAIYFSLTSVVAAALVSAFGFL